MSHAPEQVALPELPGEIKSRLIPYRATEIEEHLRVLEDWRPGLFEVMIRMIDILEADPGIVTTSVDVDEETTMKPVTIWADSTFPPAQREENLLRIHHLSRETMRFFNDLILVAVM